jgi:hypothetical protein
MATASFCVEELEPGVALVEENEAEGGRPVWRRLVAQWRLGLRDGGGDGHGRRARLVVEAAPVTSFERAGGIGVLA